MSDEEFCPEDFEELDSLLCGNPTVDIYAELAAAFETPKAMKLFSSTADSVRMYEIAAEHLERVFASWSQRLEAEHQESLRPGVSAHDAGVLLGVCNLIDEWSERS